ncbi:MAG TPA: SGNH/GDSL hydrolase family protein [Candidatus Cybelea sp.]|nr:SGNH/GDSL hydrolase family protein [Candidatus Cybelea sp.]
MLTLALLLTTAFPVRGAEPGAPVRAGEALRGVHRIVFLGDSITQAGDYIVDCECWLLAHGFEVEILDLGLASETATDLTLEENAAHLRSFGFGRPFLSERLDRVLAATKPDLLFACYGMNDGGSLPPSKSGMRRFSKTMTKLREAAHNAGVKRVVICTPPVFDDKGDVKQEFHEANLTRYTTWLLSQRANGWDIVDIHTPMRRALDEGRKKQAAFCFAADGVHPGRAGHWLMAGEILTQFFGAKLDGAASAEDFFPAHGSEIRKLVHERTVLMFDAWMTQIGHQRPGVPGGPDAKPGPPVAEAKARAAELAKRIRLEMDSK